MIYADRSSRERDTFLLDGLVDTIADFALKQLRSTILTLLTSIVQIVALIWYLVSYFPMGSQGLRLAASFGTSRITAALSG